jgi:hypothetical protein
MADGNLSILSFERARRAGTTPQPVAVISHPMMGAFGFPPVSDLPPSRIDQDGGRVMIDGRRLKTFMSESNAARLTAALQVIADLAPEFLPQPPQNPEAA